MILSLTEERGGAAARAADGNSTAAARAINTMRRNETMRRRPPSLIGSSHRYLKRSDLMESRLPFVACRQTEGVAAVGPYCDQCTDDHYGAADPEPADQRIDVDLHVHFARLGGVVEHHDVYVTGQRGEAVDTGPGLVLGEIVLADGVYHTDVLAVFRHIEGGAAHLLPAGLARFHALVGEGVGAHGHALTLLQSLGGFLLEAV